MLTSSTKNSIILTGTTGGWVTVYPSTLFPPTVNVGPGSGGLERILLRLSPKKVSQEESRTDLESGRREVV